MMKLILDKHPSLVNSTASNNKSVLMAAIEKTKTDIVKLLLERGANPNQPLADSRKYAAI